MGDDLQKFGEISKKTYKDQAIWFLNGFWGKTGGVDNAVAIEVWDYVQSFVKLDKLGPDKKGDEGNELDQFWAAKFLEDAAKTMTALARKEAFKAIDQDNNGHMSCIEFLIWHYKKGVKETVDSPQGSSPALVEAVKQMDAVRKALNQLLKLKKELQDAVAALHAEEEAYKQKCIELEKASQAGGVKGGRAKNELAQLKAEDPLPLRRAKITQEAALRKVEKQENQLMRDLSAAERAVNEAKKGGGVGPGQIWWMQRELFDADERLPSSKQRFNHRKPFFYDPEGADSGFDGGVTPRGILSPR